MLSSMKSTAPSSPFFVNLQQAFQDWVRRVIIDDDPYDPLTIEDLEEEATVHAVEAAELV
ncbi:hypothetical protein C1752_03355 [Acaryochloris thomasi RCC1774]|uniref:Uncharacterized protein n=2 Tax=Acaryochloris TaxID=155977 RepID=A0A2W1JH38_9CYAN|nr:hypothetical protein C1752_03355 [Acaryochloris thomasi RCC1774]